LATIHDPNLAFEYSIASFVGPIVGSVAESQRLVVLIRRAIQSA